MSGLGAAKQKEDEGQTTKQISPAKVRTLIEQVIRDDTASTLNFPIC